MKQFELLEEMLESVSNELSFERPKYRIVGEESNVKVEKARFQFIPKTLVLNETWFNQASKEELYTACIKELRYAYQVDALLNEKHEDEKTLASWRPFLDVYTNPNHDERKKFTVLANPMEIDAISFAQSYMDKHFGIKLNPRNLISKTLYQNQSI